MQVKYFSDQLQLSKSNPRMLEKAEEHSRLLAVRAGTSALNNSIRQMACIDLACQQYGVSFDRAKAMKLCGANEKTYLMWLSNTQGILGIS